MLVLLLIGFPKYQKFESKNKNIDWFKSFTNLGHLWECEVCYSSFGYHRDNKTIAIRGKDEFPLGKVKVLSVVYCLAIFAT